jgi:mannose-6-phosphate isomerase-like protein (cupin superfamily)
MKYFIDLDNTLCETTNSDYVNSIPIEHRIKYVNNLKIDGHHVTIWTARGAKSGVNHEEITKQQLKEWNVNYDELLMKKPDYDIYIDDKSFNVDSFWPIPKLISKSKKLQSEVVLKGWGKEIIFVNNNEYCGKILCFEKDKKFSMHYHLKKKETWYVAKGSFLLNWIETANGITNVEQLNVGDVITNERGDPHQVIALEDDSQLFEVSSQHFDDDSYRIWKGN